MRYWFRVFLVRQYLQRCGSVANPLSGTAKTISNSSGLADQKTAKCFITIHAGGRHAVFVLVITLAGPDRSQTMADM
jgi:hypothetical protein